MMLPADFIWMPFDTWIVVIGALCAGACALLGNFLVLRKMSMMGDAISHAVLPGLVVAFLLTGSHASLPMFIGAAIVGVLTALFTEWIRKLGQVEESAAMGVVFTGLFALGLLLIRQWADHIDLDPGCVLYGAIELTPLDTVQWGSFEIPRAALVLAAVFVMNLVFVLLFFKELKITSFDPSLATTQGIPARVMHYVLMTLVAITTVASFESVGSILVVAMLIVPAAAAHLLTDRLSMMILVSLVFAVFTAALGHVAAIIVPSWFGYEDTRSSGGMAVVAGLLFVGALCVAPRHGVFVRIFRRLQLSLQIAREDVLSLLWRLEDVGYQRWDRSLSRLLHDVFGIGPLVSRLAIASLRHQGMIRREGPGYHLTEQSREEARRLVRGHRLWETFLATRLNIPPDHVHAPADRVEHYISKPMADALMRDLRDYDEDPHGERIPLDDDPHRGA